MTTCSTGLVSVVVPAYNASATIEETLLSIRRQTHANLEIIVVDDGSTDHTCNLVEQHLAQDARVQLFSQTNGGVAKARNLALEQATGDFVAPIDADDLWQPDKIERQLALACERGPSTSLVYTWYASIDGKSRVRQVIGSSHEGRVLPELCAGNFVGHASSPLMPTRAVLQAGGYDPSLRARAAQGCEDWQLYLKLAEAGEFAVVKAPLTGYRQIGHGMSGDVAQMLRSHRIVMADYQLKYPEYAEELREGYYRICDYYLKEALRDQRYAAASREFWRLSRADARICAYLLHCFVRRLRPDRLGLTVRGRYFLNENWSGYDRTHPNFLNGYDIDSNRGGQAPVQSFGENRGEIPASPLTSSEGF